MTVHSYPLSTTFTTDFFSDLSTTPLPWSTLFSSAPAVQQILASFPLLAVGLVGIMLAAFQLSIARINRAFIDLFIACGFAFLGGILQIFGVLRAEFLGQPRMSRGIRIEQGIALASFLTFKLFFIYRRCMHASNYDTPMLSTHPLPLPRTRPPSEGGARWLFARPALSRRGGAVFLHSGGWERWGVFKDISRVGSWVTIIVTGVTDSVWRLGIGISSARSRGVYVASNSLQLVLLIFFAAKIIHSTSAVDSLPHRRNFIAVAPLLFGILLGIIVAIVCLVPSLFLFSETPLGRFFFLSEMYIFLLEMVILDFRRPIRDSFSLDKTASRPYLPRKASFISFGDLVEERSLTTENEGKGSPSTPALPAGIIVRRGSRVPSWFRSQSTLARKREMEEGGSAEDQEQTQESLAAGAGLPGEPQTLWSTLDAEERRLEGLRRRGEEQLGDEQMLPPRFPESVRRSDSSSGDVVVVQSGQVSLPDGGLGFGALEVVDEDGGVRILGAGAFPAARTTRPRPFAYHSPKASGSSAFNDLRFSHFDSADLDLDFAIQRDLLQRQREFDAAGAPSLTSRRSCWASSIILPHQRPPPPSDTPLPPIPAFAPAHSREASGATLRITKLLPAIVSAGDSHPKRVDLLPVSLLTSNKHPEPFVAVEKKETTRTRAIPQDHSQRPTMERLGASDSTVNTFSSSGTGDSNSDPSPSAPERHSSASLATSTSSLSLYNFPRPPRCPLRQPFQPLTPSDGGSSTPTPVSPTDITTRPSTYAPTPNLSNNLSRQASHHMTTSSRRQVVTQDGFEFELLPPRALFSDRRERETLSPLRAEGRPSLDSMAMPGDEGDKEGLRVEAEGLNVTSLIVSKECEAAAERLRLELAGRALLAEKAQDVELKGSAAGSGISEEEVDSLEVVVEEATVRRRSTAESQGATNEQLQAQPPSLIRQDSKLRVDEPGRLIPVRSDQDEARRRNAHAMGELGSISSLTGGLPSSPRCGAPRPRPIIPSHYSRPLPFPEDPTSTPSPASTASTSTLDNHRRQQLEGGSDSDTTVTSEATYDPLRPFEKPRPPPKAPRKPDLAVIRERGSSSVEQEEGEGVERLQETVSGKTKGVIMEIKRQKFNPRGRGGTKALMARVVSRVGGGGERSSGDD